MSYVISSHVCILHKLLKWVACERWKFRVWLLSNQSRKMLWTLTFPSLQNKCIIVAKLLENKAKQKENLSASNSTQSVSVSSQSLCVNVYV